MSNFDETKVKRATDGKFAEKPHAEAGSDVVGVGVSVDYSKMLSGVDKADFDCPYTINPDGTVEYDWEDPSPYYVELVDGELEYEGADKWEAVEGFSNQQGYGGPVMHESEGYSEGMVKAMHDSGKPQTYVHTEVWSKGEDDDPESAGWVLFRKKENF